MPPHLALLDYSLPLEQIREEGRFPKLVVVKLTEAGKASWAGDARGSYSVAHACALVAALGGATECGPCQK